MSTAIVRIENKLQIDVRRQDGSLVERYLGPSQEQLQYEHQRGDCGAFCGYCMFEAEQVCTTAT